MKLSVLLIAHTKICKDCVHYIPYQKECKKFSTQDIVTGDITYEYAPEARRDIAKCGGEAVHFEKNHFRILTNLCSYFRWTDWILFAPAIIIIVKLIK